MCRVTMGHLRVTIGHLWVTVGRHGVAIGHLRVTIGHLRVTIGHPRVTITTELHPKVRKTCLNLSDTMYSCDASAIIRRHFTIVANVET